jgi:hypothetical protein
MNVKTLAFVALAFVLVGTSVPDAMADVINWGDGYDFAMLVGNGAKELDLNGQGHMDMNANFGLGSGSAFRSSGPANIIGTVYFADALTQNCGIYMCPPGSAISNTTISGGTVQNAAIINAALSTVATISNGYSGGSVLDLSNANGQMVNVSGGTTHQFSVGNVQTSGAGLTINGGAGDVVVFNISGNVKFQGPVQLTGGITPDDVLFNMKSTGNNNVQSSGNYQTNLVNADLIDLGGTWNVNEITITGRWFGEESGGTYQLVSNGYIEQPTVPEPGTLAMMGTGVVGLAGLLRRKLRG